MLVYTHAHLLRSCFSFQLLGASIHGIYIQNNIFFFIFCFRAFLYEVMKIYLLPRDQREVTRKDGGEEEEDGKKNSGMEYSLTIDYPVSLSHRDYCFHSSCSSYIVFSFISIHFHGNIIARRGELHER